RSKATDQELNDTLQKVINHQLAPLTNAEFDAKFGADPDAMKRVTKFASDNGLQVVETDQTSGRVVVKGSVKSLSDAFKVQLDDYQNSAGDTNRERNGNISVPKNIAQD